MFRFLCVTRSTCAAGLGQTCPSRGRGQLALQRSTNVTSPICTRLVCSPRCLRSFRVSLMDESINGPKSTAALRVNTHRRAFAHALYDIRCTHCHTPSTRCKQRAFVHVPGSADIARSHDLACAQPPLNGFTPSVSKRAPPEGGHNRPRAVPSPEGESLLSPGTTPEGVRPVLRLQPPAPAAPVFFKDGCPSTKIICAT